MAAVASSVVHEVLGHRAVDVDKPIIDYIINVLADEDFDFGIDGNGAFEAVGDLLVDSGCVEDYEEGRLACSKISEKFGKHGLVKPKEAVRSLATPLRMFDGMDDGEPVKKKVELLDGPVLTERDRVKGKEERQREVRLCHADLLVVAVYLDGRMIWNANLVSLDVLGMPVVSVRHEGDGGSAAKDIHMENFNISVGGRDLITDASVTLSFGRHYGLVGRNGTGKTSFLRHLAMHVFMVFVGTAKYYMWNNKGDNTSALQCVLNADIERAQLLEEEAQLLSQQREIWSMKLNLGILMDILKGALTKMLFQKGLKKCIKGSNSLMHMQQMHVLLQFSRFTWPYFISIMLMGSIYLPTLFFIWCCASRW